MKYSISPFEEYYAVLPLANADQIDDSAFDAYQGKLASLHLKRYEAYARIQGLLSVVGDRPGGAETSAAVKRYAVLVRKFADFTDEWLNQLRCEPHCADDGSDSIGVARRYELMHEALHNLETQEEEPLNRILKLASEQ
jgi:hypothetical protein